MLGVLFNVKLDYKVRKKKYSSILNFLYGIP